MITTLFIALVLSPLSSLLSLVYGLSRWQCPIQLNWIFAFLVHHILHSRFLRKVNDHQDVNAATVPLIQEHALMH